MNWKTEKRKISELKEWAKNPRKMTKCNQCDTDFFSKKLCKSRVPKFCSKKCFSLSIQKIRHCEYCKIQILYNKKNKRTNKKFCSKKCSTSYRKEFGQTDEMKIKLGNFFRGKKLKLSHILKLSEVKKGKIIKHFMKNKELWKNKISESLKGKPQPWNRGKNHPNYKNGGLGKFERQKAMGRVEYKNWRRKVFSRDDFLCKNCGGRGGRIQADHIKPWSLYPELRYSVDNGQTLCFKCHLLTNTYGGRCSKKNINEICPSY